MRVYSTRGGTSAKTYPVNALLLSLALAVVIPGFSKGELDWSDHYALSRSTMCVSMMHWCSTGSPRSRLSIICAIFAPIASAG